MFQWAKNVKNEEMSRLHKWLSIEDFLFLLLFAVLWLTFGPLFSEQPLSPDVNNWSLGTL